MFIDLTEEQAEQIGGGLYLAIDKVQALNTGADFGFWADDDTYLKVDGTKKFGPKSFKTGTTRNVNVGQEVGSSGSVQLFDDDLFTRDEYLGGFTVSSSTQGKQVSRKVSGSGSTYEVFYRVF